MSEEIKCDVSDSNGYRCLVITLPDGTQDVTHQGDGCYEYIESLQKENKALRKSLDKVKYELVLKSLQPDAHIWWKQGQESDQ